MNYLLKEIKQMKQTNIGEGRVGKFDGNAEKVTWNLTQNGKGI